MSMRTKPSCLPMIVALWMSAGLAIPAQARDEQHQRLALACTQARPCATHAAEPTMTPHLAAARRDADATKKAPRVQKHVPSVAVVDYDHDLWRHQSAN